jgi:hypothetical protein
VAVRASREVEIDAEPEAILDALADIDAVPIPEFLIKRAKKIVLDVTTESLRKRVMDRATSHLAE